MAGQAPTTPTLERLLGEVVAEGTEMIAVLFVDPHIDSCGKFCSKLSSVVEEVDGNAGETPRIAVALAKERGETSDFAPLLSEFSTKPSIIEHDSLRHALSLSFVASYPEMVMVDVRTWSVVSTDGVAAIRRGSLTAANFPAGWRTNVLKAAVDTEGAPLGSSGAHMNPHDVLHCGLYAGDTVLLRSLAAGSFAPSSCVFVNAPEEEHRMGPSDTVAESGTIHISAITAANLGVQHGSFLSVELYNPPDAEAVHVTPLHHLDTAAAQAVQGVLQGFFGVTTEAAASAAVSGAMGQLAALLEESGSTSAALASAGGSSWMAKYAQHAQCLRRPVGAGQVFAVPVVGMQQPPPPRRTEGGSGKALPPHEALLHRALDAVHASNTTAAESGKRDSLALELANLQQVATGKAAEDVTWIAFHVTGTAPRGTVAVGPKTAIHVVHDAAAPLTS